MCSVYGADYSKTENCKVRLFYIKIYIKWSRLTVILLGWFLNGPFQYTDYVLSMYWNKPLEYPTSPNPNIKMLGIQMCSEFGCSVFEPPLYSLFCEKNKTERRSYNPFWILVPKNLFPPLNKNIFLWILQVFKVYSMYCPKTWPYLFESKILKALGIALVVYMLFSDSQSWHE